MRHPYRIRAALVLSAALLSACRGSDAVDAAPPQQRQPVAVPVALVTAEQEPVTLEATGSFQPQESSDVAPEASGRVVATPVDVGQFVSAGQVLVRLQGVDADLRLEEARANVSKAEAAIRLAESQNTLAMTTAQRYSALLATGDVSRTVFDQARTEAETSQQDVNTARASLLQARAQLAQAEKAARDVVVAAPFRGFVADRKVSLGEYVQPSTPVVTLVQIDPLRLQLTIPAVQAAQISVGQEVTARVDAYPDRIFAGEITSVNPSITAESRSFIVEARVRNEDRLLKPGMFATASISPGPQPAGHPGAARRGGRGREHQLVPRVRHRRPPARAAESRAACSQAAGRPGADCLRPRGGAARRHGQSRAALRHRARHRCRTRRRTSNAVAGRKGSFMQKLAELCVRRPVFATMLIAALTVVGGVTFFTLGVDRYPRIDIPVVSVNTVNRGATPESIETEVTDRIEAAVNTVAGIDELRSSSSEGQSRVTITFDLSKDPDVAAQEVRAKVDPVLRDLPETADPPVVQKQDPDSTPVILFSISAPMPIVELTSYIEQNVQKRLESVSGVGEVVLFGARRRELQVQIDPDRLNAYALTTTDIANALRSQNLELPGGRIDQGTRDLSVRTLGRVRTPQEFADVVVATRAGSSIRIRDLGEVSDTGADPTSVSVLNGKPAVTVAVRKQSGVNTVALTTAIKARMAELRQTLPPTFEVRLVRDDSEFINASLHAIQEHLILGGILAALIVLIFLRNVRSTLIAAIAIPTSIIGAFAAMAVFGFTLNQMTMLALTLMVGIVIDDAIVVLENVYRFIEEKGMSPFEAAIQGTREIGLAVTATTLSLLAVFLPVGFMGGIVGRFMASFGLTSAAAILISLLVAFTLTPMLAARWIKPAAEGNHTHDDVPPRVLRPYRSRVRPPARVLDGAPLGRRDCVRCRGGVDGPDLQDPRRELRARRRRVTVPGVGAPAGGLQPRGHAVDAGSDCPGSSGTASRCV